MQSALLGEPPVLPDSGVSSRHPYRPLPRRANCWRSQPASVRVIRGRGVPPVYAFQSSPGQEQPHAEAPAPFNGAEPRDGSATSTIEMFVADGSRTLKAELSVAAAEMRALSSELLEARQGLRQSHTEVKLLRASLAERDRRLDATKSQLLAARVAAAEKDDALLKAYGQLTAACHERSDLRQQLIDTQGELTDTRMELQQWINEMHQLKDLHSGAAVKLGRAHISVTGSASLEVSRVQCEVLCQPGSELEARVTSLGTINPTLVRKSADGERWSDIWLQQGQSELIAMGDRIALRHAAPEEYIQFEPPGVVAMGVATLRQQATPRQHAEADFADAPPTKRAKPSQAPAACVPLDSSRTATAAPAAVDAPAQLPRMVLILCGPPGSGKSTFCQQLAALSASSWVRVNQDTAGKNGKKGTRAQCVAAAIKALQAGSCVLVDRCNFDVQQRADFVALAQQLGAQAHALVFKLPVALCAQRAQQRINHEGGVEGPRAAPLVYQISALAEKAGLPTRAEGLFSMMVCQSDAEDVLRKVAMEPERHSSKFPGMVVGEQCVLINDAYPKAKCHGLVIARDPELDGPDQLRTEHLALLQRMQDVGERWAAEQKAANPALEPFKLGFHAIPSMRQLHLHVISQDFESACLKHKKHWNSFTTAFFRPISAVREELEREGRLALDKAVAEQLLKADLRCHRCRAACKTMPALKAHTSACKVPLQS
ncbi:hypothetical protein WJX72_010530 [[Myrmecia] bisecta]|uniref:Aprataxin C2HE/C2H2/C2HC zinc finger domain-containing protein n=1 Tax=[Myrmecia] bisecta TaxID=41462 RepID=A0AAW1R9M9_9CHLO